MHNMTRTLLVIICTASLVIPLSNAFIRNGTGDTAANPGDDLSPDVNDRQFDCDGEDDAEMCVSNSIPKDPSRITRSLPGETPMVSKERTRYARDIWLKSISVTERPYEHYGIGVVGGTTSFEVIFQNNGSAGDVEIRMKTTHERMNNDFPYHWEAPVEHKEIKMVASAGQGAVSTISFDWTPTASNWYVVNFTAFEVGDPKPDNNRLYYRWVIVGLHADECNNTGVAFKDPAGNFRIDDVYNDPAPDAHSLPNAWCHCDDSHECPAGNNTLDLPELDQNDFWRVWAIYALFWFTGELPAGDVHKVYQRGDGGEWRTRASITAEEASAGGLADGWFRWATTDRPAMLLNDRSSDNIEVRIAVGEGGGAEKGFYFDDLFIWGYQNYTNVGDIPPTANTYVNLTLETEDTDDVNENGVEELTGEAGGEVEFELTVENNGTADITSIALSVDGKPEGWDVELEPSSIAVEMNSGDTRQVTATVAISASARSSEDFGDDYVYNPYIIKISAEASGQSPGPDWRDDVIPEVFTDTAEMEVIVTTDPGIALTTAADNLTGPGGSTLEYTISVENTGNCNLTKDIETEVEITVKEKPVGAWTVTLGERDLEIEHDETEDVSLSVKSPVNGHAGYFELVVEFAIEEYEYAETITLTAGVDQEFGLEMELKNDANEAITLDPAEERDRYRLIDFEIRNVGNGIDRVVVEVTPEDPEDKDWFTPPEDAIVLDPAGTKDAEGEFSLELNVPEDAEVGDHRFTVKGISELDDDTETDEMEIVITVQRPDISPSSDIEFVPSVPVLGEEVSVKLKVYNNGTAPSGRFSVYIYVAPDGGEEALVFYHQVADVTAGSSVNLPSFKYVFGEYAGYTVRVVADPEGLAGDMGNVTEEDETNNEAEVSVKPVAPELVFDKDSLVVEMGIEEIVLDGGTGAFGITAKETYTLTVTVDNEGDHDAEDVVMNLKILYQTDAGGRKEAEFNTTVDLIEADENGDFVFRWTPRLHGTDYELSFMIDPEGDIPESDEDTNDLEPDENLRTSQSPDTGGGGVGGTVIISIVVIVLIAAGVAVFLVISKKKKKEEE